MINNVLVIGNNAKIASLFRLFSEDVFIGIDARNSVTNRIDSEVFDFDVIKSNIFSISKLFSIKKILYFIKIFKLYNFSLVFTNTKSDLVNAKIASLFLKKKPILLCTFHNSFAWDSQRNVKLLSFLIKHYTDGCVCLAKFVYNKLISCNVPRQKLIYLTNTIDGRNIKKKENYSISSKIKIVYTATVYEGKNQLLLLKAIKLLNNPNIEVDFFGEILSESFFLTLKKFVDDNNLQTVNFRGGVPREYIKENLSKYDLYVSCSSKEMSPYNVLEAFASALPIVATDVSGNNDLIIDNYNGLLCKNDELDLANKISLLLNDESLRKKLGETGYNYINNEKSLHNHSKILFNFIMELGHK